MSVQRPLFSLLAYLIIYTSFASAEEGAGRYTMTPTGDGFVRLDTHTGTMSLCKREDGKLTCEVMEDSERALRQEIEKLKAENNSLKEQVEQMEETLSLGANPDNPEPEKELQLPSEEDVDTVFDYLEGILGKLRERMEKLQEKHDNEGGGTPL